MKSKIDRLILIVMSVFVVMTFLNIFLYDTFAQDQNCISYEVGGCFYAESPEECYQWNGIYDPNLNSWNCSMICCKVKSVDGTYYLGVEYNDLVLYPYFCQKIDEISNGGFEYVQMYNITGADPCTQYGILNPDGTIKETGFHALTFCGARFEFNVIDSEKGTTVDDLRISISVYDSNGNLLTEKQYTDASGSFDSGIIPFATSCSGFDEVKYKIIVSADNYLTTETPMYSLALTPGSQVTEKDLGNIVLHPITSFWKISVTSNVKDVWIEVSDDSGHKDYFFLNQSPFIYRIPRRSDVHQLTFNAGSFIRDDKKYYLSETKTINVGYTTEDYSVDLNFKYITPIANVMICWDKPADNAFAILMHETNPIAVFFKPFTLEEGSKICTENISVFDAGYYKVQGYVDNEYSEVKRINIGNTYNNFYLVDLSDSSTLDQMCYDTTKILELPITPNSFCIKPCRKFYTYNCRTKTCEISDDLSNRIINQEQPGICDNGYMCDLNGNCVPTQNVCQHKGTFEDCKNLDAIDGFYYCDESNQWQFINLSEMFLNGHFDKIVRYCNICSQDKECHLCNNPNPYFGKSVTNFTTCLNLSNEPALCKDRILTEDDLQKIKNEELGDIDYNRSINLSIDSDKYEYCFLNGCGFIYSGFCNDDCNVLNQTYYKFTGQNLQCLDPSNALITFDFATGCSIGKVCGVSKSEACYGRSYFSNPNLKEKYRYLCEIQGGNLQGECCDVPLLPMPNCGVYEDTKLKDLTLDNISVGSPDLYNIIQKDPSYFSSDKSRIWCNCYGVLMNLAEDKYCCFGGPSDVPCGAGINLNISVYINKSGILVPAKYGKLHIVRSDVLPRYEADIILDENGRFIFPNVPSGNYSFTFLHSVLYYKANIVVKTGSTTANCVPTGCGIELPAIGLNPGENHLRFIVPDTGDYVNIKGYVVDVDEDNNVLPNIDVKVRFNNSNGYFGDMILVTDHNGKYNYGYVKRNEFDYVILTANSFANPFYTKNETSYQNESDVFDYSNINLTIHLRNSTNISGYILDDNGNAIANARIRILNLHNPPSSWPVDASEFNKKANEFGFYNITHIPCGNSDDPVMLMFEIKHPLYATLREAVFISNCDELQHNFTLHKVNCLYQNETPKNINFTIDHNATLHLNWTFACNDYINGFYIYLGDGSGNYRLISDLIPVHIDGNYSYSWNHNLSLLELGSQYINHLNSLYSLSRGQGKLYYGVTIAVAWEKPFVKLTFSPETSKQFDYAAINSHWYKTICDVVYKHLGFNFYNTSNADVFNYSVLGKFIPWFGKNINYSCIENKSNVFDLEWFKNLSRTQLKNGYNDSLNSFFVNGPFLAFGLAFNKSLPLPIVKGEALRYYYKMCGDVKNCYDYTTKDSCELNPCLPFECEWHKFNSLPEFENLSDDVGVCVPKDPTMINCSYFEIIKHKFLGFDVFGNNPLIANKTAYDVCYLLGLSKSIVDDGMLCTYSPVLFGCVKEINNNAYSIASHFAKYPLNTSSNLIPSVTPLQIMRYRGTSYESIRLTDYSIINNSYPPFFKFANLFYYKTPQDLLNYLNVSLVGNLNVTLYDVDVLRGTETKSDFNVDLNIPYSKTCDLKNKPYQHNSSVCDVDDKHFNFTNTTISFYDSGENFVSKNYTIIYDDESPNVEPVQIEINTLYRKFYHETAFYAINISFNVDNEDWIIPNLKIVPKRLFDSKDSRITYDVTPNDYKVLQNMTMKDSLNRNFSKIIYLAKYGGAKEFDDLYDACKNAGLPNWNFNQSNKECLLAAGYYKLEGTIKDKLGNTRYISLNFVLPPKRMHFNTGYYRTYFVNETAEIFVESITGSVQECKFDVRDVDFDQMEFDYVKMSNTKFEYNLTPEFIVNNLATLSGANISTININGKIYPRGLITIFSKCKLLDGRIQSPMPIYIYYDPSNYTCNLSVFKSDVAFSSGKFISTRIFNSKTQYYFVCSKPYGSGEFTISSDNVTYILSQKENVFNASKGLIRYDFLPIPKPFIHVNFNGQYCYNTSKPIHRFVNGRYYFEIPFRCYYPGKFAVDVDDGYNETHYEFNYYVDDADPLLLDYASNALVCVDGNDKYLYTNKLNYKLMFDVFNPMYYSVFPSRLFNVLRYKQYDLIIPQNSNITLVFVSGSNNYTFEVSLYNGNSNVKFYINDVLNNEINDTNIAYILFERNAGLKLKEIYFDPTQKAYASYEYNYGSMDLKDVYTSSMSIIYLTPHNDYHEKIFSEYSSSAYSKQISTSEFRHVFEYSPLDEYKLDGRLKLWDNDTTFKNYNIDFKYFDGIPDLGNVKFSTSGYPFDITLNTLGFTQYVCIDGPLTMSFKVNMFGWRGKFLRSELTLNYSDRTEVKNLTLDDLGIGKLSFSRSDLIKYILTPINISYLLEPNSEYCDANLFSKQYFVGTIIPTICTIPKIVDVKLSVPSMDLRYDAIILENTSERTAFLINMINKSRNYLLPFVQPHYITITFDNLLTEAFVKNISLRCAKDFTSFTFYKEYVLDSQHYKINGKELFIDFTALLDYNYCDVVVYYNNGFESKELKQRIYVYSGLSNDKIILYNNVLDYLYLNDSILVPYQIINPQQGIYRYYRTMEICNNGIDDDNDGVPDEKYYYDYDGDGYGTDDYKCNKVGYYHATIAGDCDDHDASIVTC